MMARNRIARAFLLEERADGTIKVEVQLPHSRVLHGERSGQGCGPTTLARRTFWLFQASRSSPDSPPFHPGALWGKTLDDRALAYGRSFYRLGRHILDTAEQAVEAELRKFPPDPLAAATTRIAALEAEVAKLKRRRRAK